MQGAFAFGGKLFAFGGSPSVFAPPASAPAFGTRPFGASTGAAFAGVGAGTGGGFGAHGEGFGAPHSPFGASLFGSAPPNPVPVFTGFGDAVPALGTGGWSSGSPAGGGFGAGDKGSGYGASAGTLPNRDSKASGEVGLVSAQQASKGLLSLGRLATTVRRKRAESNSEEVRSQLQGIAKLVDAMRACARCPWSELGREQDEDARSRWLKSVAESGRAAGLAGARSVLQDSQRVVRAACVSGPDANDANTQELAQRITNRDLARAELSRQCQKVLVGIETAVRPGQQATGSGLALCEQLLNTSREQLAWARDGLDIARQSMADGRLTPQRVKAGEGSARMEEQGVSRSARAVQTFESWKEERRKEKEEAALSTDAALEGLKANFLCFEPSVWALDPNCLSAAGAALDRELGVLSKSAVDGLPLRQILTQGQRLLESLEEEEQVLQAVTAVCRDVSDELTLHQEALDGSGLSRKAMQQASASVVAKSELVVDAREDLDDATKKVARAKRKSETEANVATLTADEAAKRKGLKEARAALQEDFSVLLMHEREFPEVLVTLNQAVAALMLGAGVTLTRDVLHVLDPTMSLAGFDECHVLSTLAASRHVVFKVRAGEEWFALKEYAVTDAREMSRSLREAALLWRLKHPAIAEIKTVFFEHSQQSTKMYIQMPLYVNGQLDQWIVSRAPAWWMVRQALIDVLCGLEHLHEMQLCSFVLSPRVSPAP